MEAYESDSDSDSDSSSDDDNDVQVVAAEPDVAVAKALAGSLGFEYEFGWYQPWESSTEPEAPYTRKMPPVCLPDKGGDTMVCSMIKTYAVEEKKCEPAELGGVCAPTGNFYVMKSSAKMAAKEVLGTHK